MRAYRSVCVAAFLTALGVVPTSADPARPEQALSGSAFQTPETRQLEASDGNPAFLWLGRGERLWEERAGPEARSCASCHGSVEASMKGVAARHPAVGADGASLVNIEGRINDCRVGRQRAARLAPESDDLLALTLLVTRQSHGMERTVSVDGAAHAHFERGAAVWVQRQGQLDLACSQCHDGNVGRRLRGDVISQGQSDGWPAYRLEWQTLGSLHRRLRACNIGVRAEVKDYGSAEYLALELYLAWRGRGLPISAPGVRR